jgi:HD-GYP domain-containing protein (c-di-GMP phosphodiesterase class II)
MADDGSPRTSYPDLQERIARLEMLLRVVTAMSTERDLDKLFETILFEAKNLCHAEGGTVYLYDGQDFLDFAIAMNDSMGFHYRRAQTAPAERLMPLRLWEPSSKTPNHRNVATYAATEKRSVNIPNAYDEVGFDFSGTRKIDGETGYRSVSFLTIPVLDAQDRLLGVLQLINARDKETETIVPFSGADQELVEMLAFQVGLALSNRLLREAQERLLESFIKTIADGIDAKSAHTGAHCSRVPILTEMITRAVCEESEGPYRDFSLDTAQWYELRIAAWLHDCGKITTPVHVIDKATKLQTIHDRIHEVSTRIDLLKREAEVRHLKRLIQGDVPEESQGRFDAEIVQLEDDRQFLEWANIGREHLDDESQERIHRIAATTYLSGGQKRPLLSYEEVHNLTIPRGTLTDEERLTINGHMVETIRMLEALPFPSHLKQVPILAGGHHERMDGEGYPKGIYAGDLPVPARVMAIADVFEALTAQDRPYKEGMALSKAMSIMGEMKRTNHLDPELFDIFVRSGTYREYALRYLPERLIDEVDEGALLAVKPRPMDLPPKAVRDLRHRGFLPEYEHADRMSWHAGDFDV